MNPLSAKKNKAKGFIFREIVVQLFSKKHLDSAKKTVCAKSGVTVLGKIGIIFEFSVAFCVEWFWNSGDCFLNYEPFRL